uniref:Uncharacterized protein n=1 Tax=Amphimedon queenslandica TaxID=400682 RepID=A0A1X7SGH4_AMPQE
MVAIITDPQIRIVTASMSILSIYKTPQRERKREKETEGIHVFKTLIDTGDREFSSNRQDVQEFFPHLLSAIEQAE